MTTTNTTPDVPQNPDDVEQPESKVRKTKPKAAPTNREPTDPITVHLWRYPRPTRVALLMPFVDRQVRLERWYGRVAANGDETYLGTILAVATTTIGSAADLVILKTTAGQVWAISTAQVAHLELAEPKPATRRTRSGAGVAANAQAAVEEVTPKTRRRRKTEPAPEVPGDTAA